MHDWKLFFVIHFTYQFKLLHNLILRNFAGLFHMKARVNFWKELGTTYQQKKNYINVKSSSFEILCWLSVW